MKLKLNQVVAILAGKKTKSSESINAIYQNLSKPTLFEGINKTYKPLDEDGENQPPESKNIQYTVGKAIKDVASLYTDMLDVTAMQEYGNTTAKADVKIGEEVILSSVPVPYLLYLEKRATDIQTFISKIPTLDPAETWHFDNATDSYRSQPAVRNSTKKAFKNHVKAAATDKHPAQVDVYTEDVKIGEWTTIKFSGAIEAKTKNEYLARAAKFLEAVKIAREEANDTKVEEVSVGKPIFEYIFGR